MPPSEIAYDSELCLKAFKSELRTDWIALLPRRAAEAQWLLDPQGCRLERFVNADGHRLSRVDSGRERGSVVYCRLRTSCVSLL
jgi:hypothetical protein